jgi:AcrR family transcriptional regulator
LDIEARRPRHGGRGRSKKLDAAIARATLAVLVRAGPSGFSIEAVAREVGCSKSSIYRRYPTRESLILQAAIDLLGPSDPPPSDTGLLDWLVQNRVNQLAQPAFVLAATMLMDEAARGTDLGTRYRPRSSTRCERRERGSPSARSLPGSCGPMRTSI